MAIPRPIPVEPSCSRFMICRTMSSETPALIYPVARRLSTISRTTASLAVAVRAGTIASRTTKSVIAMVALLGADSRGLAAGPRGAAPRVTDVRRPAVVLDFLFIPAELGLQLVQGQIDRHLQFTVRLAAHEIVFVLGGHQDLDRLLVLSHVYRNLDHRQPFEEVQQLVGFLTDHLLSGVAQVAVTSGDLDLHKCSPW